MGEMQIAINWTDFSKFGCVKCGCEYCYTQGVQGGGAAPVRCGECGTNFIILADGMTKSTIGFGISKPAPAPEGGGFVEAGTMIFSLDENNPAPEEPGYYYPELQKHPREGTPKHPYEAPDERPDGGGEYWGPRGIGYDLSGFVKCKAAGERIVAMFAGALGRTPKTWLDYRPNEPKWIQVKVQPSEADVELLYELTKETGIITPEIIAKVVKR